MSETVPVHMRSRGEYDLFYPDRVKAQRLGRNVIYTLMLEIEDDNVRSSMVTVELPSLSQSIGSNVVSSAVDVAFMDDDARTVFQLPGMIMNDELYLHPSSLILIPDGGVMSHGYFLADENNVEMAMQLHEIVGTGTSVS